MLTLTISDPHSLTPTEKRAMTAFWNAIVDPTAERIAPDDNPSTGAGTGLPPVIRAIPPAPPPTIDPAAIFGGSPAIAAIPTPPVPGVSAAAPSVPSATPAASVPPAGGKEFDAAGLPWDHRIHAATKTKKQDGKWTKKKNVEAATIVTVEAELRALLAIPPAGGSMPLPPGLPIPPTFADLMGWITTEIAGQRLSQVDVVAGVSPLGLTSIVGLDARPDLIPQVRTNLERIIAERVPQ